MFTVKAVNVNHVLILEAESFQLNYQNESGAHERTRDWCSVTLHHRDGDKRLDLGDSPVRDFKERPDSHLGCFTTLYIMNDKGKTVEQLSYGLGTPQ